MPVLIKLLEIQLSSTLTKRYAISGWPVTYNSQTYDNDGTFVSIGDLKFSLELENNPFEVTLHLGDSDVLDSINSYSYRFRDATLTIGEWTGTQIDPTSIIVKKGYIDTHSDPGADFTVGFTISSYLDLASKQRADVSASAAHAIKLKDGVFGDDNKTTIDTIFDKTGDDWGHVTLGQTRAHTTQTQIGGHRACSRSDHWLGKGPIYQTTNTPAMEGVRLDNNGDTFHSPVAYGRTKLNYQLVNAWNPTPAAVAVAYPTITWDSEDAIPGLIDTTQYLTMVFAVCHGPVQKLEVYNATNDAILTLINNGQTSGTGSIRRTSGATTSLAVIDVINNGVNNVALAKSVTASAGAYETTDIGIGYTLVHVTAIASGFWENGIPDLTFVADSTHLRTLSSSGISAGKSGSNGSGEVMYDFINNKEYGMGLGDEYLDADSFYDFQANSLDLYPDKLRGSITGSGSFIKFLERMQQSCACKIYEESGVIKIWYGDILDNSDIKKEFKDNGKSNTNCIITQQNPRSRSVYNEVRAKYYAIYDAVDQPPDNIQKTVVVADSQYFADDNEIKSTVSFDLDFLTLDADGDGFVDPVDEQQINEIANLVLQKSRLFQEVEIVTSFDEAQGLKLGDLVRCEVDRYGWLVADRRLFFIREIIYTQDGNVSIVGQRHSNTVYGGIDSFTNLDVENVFPTRIYGLNSLESYLTTGPQGPQGRFLLTIYIRATTTPTTPTGGTYVNSTNTLTPPTDWFTTIGNVPDGAGNIYFSQATYNPADDADSITPSWSVAAQAGSTGAAGADAVTINATSNDYSIIYDSDGANPTPATVTLTGTAQNVINGFFRFTGGGSDFPDETTFTDGDTALTATRTFTLPTTITASTFRSFNVAVADGDQDELAFDVFTVTLIQTAADGTNGTNGTNGTDGEDAFTPIMQNEATVLPATSAGFVTSYAGSSNVIEVYRGGTQLTYTAAAGDPSTSQFKVSLVATSITAGAVTLSGSNAAISNASAFLDAQDTATINATITVRNEADDANISFVKIQSFTKSKEGGSGTRGSGDWHFRVGETLKGTYTDTELSEFLAMVVPGTEGDAPIQGDRLWIFASPSDDDQDVTEQQVYIWVGNTWDNQAAAIDGNLLVSGTVTADNVVADIGITSPVITGGLLQGAIIRAGLLISQITVFQINQNILTQEPTLTFLNSDNQTVPVSEVFTQSAGAAPFRIETSGYDATANRVLTNVSIAQNSRLLNVNQVPLPATVDIVVNDTRRNWGAWGDYTISIEPRDDSVGSIFEGGINIRRPSLTLQIRKTSDDSIISSTAFSTPITNINAAKPATQTVDNAFFVGSVTYEGGYSVSTYCVNETWYGECKDRDSNNYRNGVRTVFNGYVRLVDDQYLRVLTDWDGDEFPDGYGRCFITGRSVAAEGTTDNRFYPQPDVQLLQELETPVLMAPTVSIPLLINNEFVIADPASDDVTVDPIPIPFPPPLIIDGEVTDLVNISANALVGDLNGVNVYGGDIELGDVVTVDTGSISERIDITTAKITGSGFALQNDDTLGAVLALGNFEGVAQPDDWVSGTDYLAGEGVTYLTIAYTALNDITGGTTIPPNDTTNWLATEFTPANYLYYTESTGLVVGGTVTAGSIRGGSLNSSAIPASGESGSYIDLDGGTFVFGNSQENLRFDGTDFTLSGIPVDGELIINNSIDGNKLNVNTVIARTIRSDNYIPPSLTDNPPIQGYSLEHVEGIGFFEELRADLTGTVTAPSQTPSQGTYTYNTSAATVEYLNISVGDTFTDFPVVYEGVTYTFKGILSSPIYELTLPDSLRFFNNPAFNDNWAGAALLTNGAAYEYYTNLSSNSQSYGADYRVGMVWVGYDDNDNIVTTVPIRESTNVETAISWYTGITRIISAPTAEDTADEIDDFSTLNTFELSTPLPTVLKLQMILISLQSDLDSSVTDRPGDTSPLAITGGIRANSSISFEVRSNDGTTMTETITQITS